MDAGVAAGVGTADDDVVAPATLSDVAPLACCTSTDGEAAAPRLTPETAAFDAATVDSTEPVAEATGAVAVAVAVAAAVAEVAVEAVEAAEAVAVLETLPADSAAVPVTADPCFTAPATGCTFGLFNDPVTDPWP